MVISYILHISKEWISEIQKRCHEIDDGKKTLISGEKVLSNFRMVYADNESRGSDMKSKKIEKATFIQKQ